MAIRPTFWPSFAYPWRGERPEALLVKGFLKGSANVSGAVMSPAC